MSWLLIKYASGTETSQSQYSTADILQFFQESEINLLKAGLNKVPSSKKTTYATARYHEFFNQAIIPKLCRAMFLITQLQISERATKKQLQMPIFSTYIQKFSVFFRCT